MVRGRDSGECGSQREQDGGGCQEGQPESVAVVEMKEMRVESNWNQTLQGGWTMFRWVRQTSGSCSGNVGADGHAIADRASSYRRTTPDRRRACGVKRGRVKLQRSGAGQGVSSRGRSQPAGGRGRVAGDIRICGVVVSADRWPQRILPRCTRSLSLPCCA